MDVVLYEPPEVVVVVPHEECEARDCDDPVAASLVWWDEAADQVSLWRICGLHAFTLRGVPRGAVYPLGGAPSLDLVMHAIRQHVAQRQQSVFVRRPTGFRGSVNFTYGTQTSTSWIRFG